MVQDEEEAEYRGMPHSAVETGLADFILPAAGMGNKLVDFLRQSRKVRRAELEGHARTRLDKAGEQVLHVVQSVTGHDFTRYKKSTIERRIRRRMALHQCEQVSDYLTLLKKEPPEVQSLFQDLLINVTSFFRDPEAYQALSAEFDKVLEERSAGDPVRVWVPGCATGEEAYSLAILLVEAMERLDRQFEVKVFATDINPNSIQFARAGLYPDTIEENLSEQRLKRFFHKTGARYRVSGQLRDLVIFSPHNVAGDAPFSNIDLVSCRNLLIYMDQQLQKKVLPLLHYSLKDGGLLFLGTSEDVGQFSDLFTPVHRKWKVFRARPASPHRHHEVFGILGRGFGSSSRDVHQGLEGLADDRMLRAKPEEGRRDSIRELVEKAIVEEYAPPGVLVDGNNRILYFHGDTSRFLTTPQGNAVFDLLRMARGDLPAELERLLLDARRKQGRASAREIQVYLEHEAVKVELSARRLHYRHQGDDVFLLTFRQMKADKADLAGGEDEADARVAALKRELYATRQDLQATIEELETTNEELQSTNEELQANNEELQSTNEELETSREELQSTNEELETVNSELQNKNLELKEASDDMKNLFEATDACTIIVDGELRIRRFTPAATRIFRLIDVDLGRPITDIASVLLYEEFGRDVEGVVENLERRSREVRTRDDHWYLVRMLPYRTSGNVISGAVITFTEITAQKEAELAAVENRNLSESILETLRDPLLVLDEDLRVVRANQAFFRYFEAGPQGTDGVPLFELGNRQWDIPELRRVLEEIVPENNEVRDYRVEGVFPNLGRRAIILNARRVERGPQRPKLVLLTFNDVTDGKDGGGKK